MCICSGTRVSCELPCLSEPELGLCQGLGNTTWRHAMHDCASGALPCAPALGHITPPTRAAHSAHVQSQPYNIQQRGLAHVHCARLEGRQPAVLLLSVRRVAQERILDKLVVVVAERRLRGGGRLPICCSGRMGSLSMCQAVGCGRGCCCCTCGSQCTCRCFRCVRPCTARILLLSTISCHTLSWRIHSAAMFPSWCWQLGGLTGVSACFIRCAAAMQDCKVTRT